MPATVNAPRFWYEAQLDDMLNTGKPETRKVELLPGTMVPGSWNETEQNTGIPLPPITAMNDPNKTANDAQWINEVIKKWMEWEDRGTADYRGVGRALPDDYR